MSASSPLTVGSLFSGIGGLDLGLERAGMRVIWQSEIDPYASKVLAKHWPTVPNLGDVTKVDWSTVERPDLVCGGYPCQPFSFAGRRAGSDDPRHLWPHFADALRHLRPRWALLENVPGHLSLGFDEVLADLAALGFDAEWELVPAAAFGAPHLRFRLFVVAHARSGWGQDDGLQAGRPSSGGRGAAPDAADANGQGEHDGPVDAEMGGAPEPVAYAHSPRFAVFSGGTSVAEREGVGTFGDSGWWNTEPDVGRVVDGFSPGLDRVARLRCLGNAVVPQVAEYVGRLIVNADV